MEILDKALELNEETINAPNLCDRFSEQDLSRIGGSVYLGYDRDLKSRFHWEKRMSAAMDLAMQIQEPKNYPWPGCSNVVFPLITIGALQFSARSYSNMIQGTNVVRYRVIGKEDVKARERALRIGKHMSWQVLEQDQAWEEQHDRLLINLSIVGCNFIKTYYDSARGYPVSELVPAKDLVIDYYAKSVEACARKTQEIPLYRNEVYERSVREIFVDVTKQQWFNQTALQRSSDPQADRRRGTNPSQSDHTTPFKFLEQHCWWDFDKDGYYEPYTITIQKESKKVVRIVSRIAGMEDVLERKGKVYSIKAEEHYTKYSFIPSPDGGIYDMGFGMFLGPLNEAVNTAINQLIDAGTMQTALGGFLGRGSKIRGGVYTMAPWEWKRVDSTGDDLRKNLVPFPDRQPSDVLFKLIGLLVEYSNRIAGTVDATVGENPGQNTPASTYQGMYESGMQVYGMIFKRVWRSMKEEFKKRYELNKIFLDRSENFGPSADFIRREDYTGSPDQIAPVANPRITSTVMRVQQAVAVKQDAMMTPGYDVPEVTREFLESLEIEGIDRLFPGPGNVPQGHEAPNPKAMVEQLKLQGIMAKIQNEKMRWANELMEEKRVNDAKIRLMLAQALQAMSDANATDAATKLEAYEKLVETYNAYNEMIDKRLQTLLGDGNEGSNGAGVPRLEGKSDNGSDSKVSVEVEGGSKVSVGSGRAAN